MASAVDICNLALSHIGQQPVVISIDPPDGSAEADLFGRIYPMARDKLLEMHPWRFATRRATLARLADNELEGHWAYAYALPADALRPLAVLPPNSTDDLSAVNFTVELASTGSPALYTDVEDAVLKYIARVEDTTRYSPLFVSALARLLASYAAGSISRNATMVQAQETYFAKEYLLATAADARSGRNTKHAMLADYVPPHLRARSS